MLSCKSSSWGDISTVANSYQPATTLSTKPFISVYNSPILVIILTINIIQIPVNLPRALVENEL